MYSQELLLVLLFTLGIIARSFKFLPADLHRRINKFIVFIPLPAITLSKIPHLQITHEVLFPIASAWIIFAVSIAYAFSVGKWLNFSKQTIACIILCCGLGNTSFVGYPVLKYFYGEESIRYAIFVDQPGSFLIMSTFGVLIAAYFSASGMSPRNVLSKLISFPPFIVFMIALFIPAHYIEGSTLNILNFLGKFMIPLAMLSLGLQFKWNLKSIEWHKFAAGVIYKLLLAPLLIYFLYFVLMHQRGELYSVSVLECAMPPMITSSIIATEYGLDEALANSLPTIGLLFSIPTLFIWHWLLPA